MYFFCAQSFRAYHGRITDNGCINVKSQKPLIYKGFWLHTILKKSFPLDRCGWLCRYIVNQAVDFLDLVYYTV